MCDEANRDAGGALTAQLSLSGKVQDSRVGCRRVLARLMTNYAFRKALGAERRARAWRHLGARIADNVALGPGVVMRFPEHISIGDGSRLSGRIIVDGWGPIAIGRNVMINDNVRLQTAQHDIDSPTFDDDIRSITIGDYVWLPIGVIVLPGVSIGDCAVIGSGSVVTRDVPAYAVAAGNPAQVVKERARVRFSYVPGSF